MPRTIKAISKRRKIIFMSNIARQTAPTQSSIDKLGEIAPNEQSSGNVIGALTGRIEEVTDQDDLISYENAEYLFPRSPTMPAEQDRPPVPDLFTSPPPIRDDLVTETSDLQDETVQECLPYLSGTDDSSKGPFDFNPHGLPPLEREKHTAFLHNALRTLPAAYVGYDASRPWILYWALTGLYLLGDDISQYRERAMQTLSPMQNQSGGFGAGHGQTSHCAASYAAVLSLAMVGGNAALDMIDRRSLWRWLGELKKGDGGFQVCLGGEEDVRGAYCSMVMVSLLDLPLELPPNVPARRTGCKTFVSGLPEYLSRCQTFEGGISCAPDREAHGGYAFCALACLSILGPPHELIPKYLDLPLLLSWLSARQYAPEGGFAGRTNKLIDGCYSWWVGGCWPLLEAALNGPQISEQYLKTPITGSLYSREGLVRYLLCCCQSERGGLRDKPGKYADAYHTCYTLAGLSSAQHHHYLKTTTTGQAAEPSDSVFHWASSRAIPMLNGQTEQEVYDEEDRVHALHPVFVIPPAAVERSRLWYRQKGGF